MEKTDNKISSNGLPLKADGQEAFHLRGVIKIHAPAIDFEETITHIRQNLQQRRLEAAKQGLDFETLLQRAGHQTEQASCLGEGAAAAFDRADFLSDQIFVYFSSPSSSGSIIGRLLTEVRYYFHKLVIYYVNSLGKRQVAFNLTVIDLMRRLVEGFNKQEQDVQQELRDLRRRVAELEAKLEQRG